MGNTEENHVKLKIQDVDRMAEIINWSNNHLGSTFNINMCTTSFSNYIFSFSSAKDHLLFKLKWA